MPLLETRGSGSALSYGLNGSIQVIPAAVTSGLALFVDAGQIASYPGSGNLWKDISGNNKNGTIINGSTFSANNSGSLGFNGTNQYVSFGDLGYNALTAMTMQMFVKVNANSGSYNGFAGSQYGGNDFSTGFNWDQGPVSTSSFNSLGYEGTFHPGWVDTKNTDTPFGQWVNIAVTATSGGTMYLYTNGVQDGTMALSSGTMGTQAFTLAARPYNAGTTGLNGSIGQAMFYTRVLSQSEIQSNFNKFKSRYGL